jgi:hypothetical protein
MDAPARQRQCVEQYNIVKRATQPKRFTINPYHHNVVIKAFTSSPALRAFSRLNPAQESEACSTTTVATMNNPKPHLAIRKVGSTVSRRMNIASTPSATKTPAIMRSMLATRLAVYEIVRFENVLAVRKPYQLLGGTRSTVSGLPIAMNTKPPAHTVTQRYRVANHRGGEAAL